jgi:hypothetical protein
MTKQEKYYEMWDKYKARQITAEVWMEYCLETFNEIMCEPEVIAVMERLKHR